ncbi:uncharacterized protein LOC129309225 [Prosopis cineraria]|uniref:uncharacterized protein LOC129309225 n=1 Tax=Prosopis cineraria TaxID=364024 RepID=UPI00240F286F|nr:uncharacterized protein LOC129309225 [Prosopis cineraria]
MLARKYHEQDWHLDSCLHDLGKRYKVNEGLNLCGTAIMKMLDTAIISMSCNIDAAIFTTQRLFPGRVLNSDRKHLGIFSQFAKTKTSTPRETGKLAQVYRGKPSTSLSHVFPLATNKGLRIKEKKKRRPLPPLPSESSGVSMRIGGYRSSRFNEFKFIYLMTFLG